MRALDPADVSGMRVERKSRCALRPGLAVVSVALVLAGCGTTPFPEASNSGTTTPTTTATTPTTARADGVANVWGGAGSTTTPITGARPCMAADYQHPQPMDVCTTLGHTVFAYGEAITVSNLYIGPAPYGDWLVCVTITYRNNSSSPRSYSMGDWELGLRFRIGVFGGDLPAGVVVPAPGLGDDYVRPGGTRSGAVCRVVLIGPRGKYFVTWHPPQDVQPVTDPYTPAPRAVWTRQSPASWPSGPRCPGTVRVPCGSGTSSIPTPRSVAVSVGRLGLGFQVAITWRPLLGYSGWTVYRGDNDTPFALSQECNCAGHPGAALDGEVIAGHRYTYYVVTVGKDHATFSLPAAITVDVPKALTYPNGTPCNDNYPCGSGTNSIPAPRAVAVSVRMRTMEVVITWQPPPGYLGWQVYRGDDQTPFELAHVCMCAGSPGSAFDGNVAAGHRYTYYVVTMSQDRASFSHPISMTVDVPAGP
jgi:hypothetical protein